MASAATVAPSATASQKSSASANPTALDRASARYRAAQSRYRQAKAALKAIKRQIVPVDAFGNRKPRLRGWLHLATLPLCIAASIVLICIAPAGSVKAACAVYGASAMLLFGNSALLHVVPWRSAKVTRVLCGIDYSNIFLIIAGTNTPVLFALSPAIRRPYLTVIWVTAAIGTILHIVWLRTPNWVFTTVYVVLGLAPVTLIPQLWTAPQWVRLRPYSSHAEAPRISPALYASRCASRTPFSAGSSSTRCFTWARSSGTPATSWRFI